VDVLFTAPTAFRAIKREDPDGIYIKNYDLSRFRMLFLAGERCDPDTLRWAEDRLNVPVIDHWWQTETGWPLVPMQRASVCFRSGRDPAQSRSLVTMSGYWMIMVRSLPRHRPGILPYDCHSLRAASLLCGIMNAIFIRPTCQNFQDTTLPGTQVSSIVTGISGLWAGLMTS